MRDTSHPIYSFNNGVADRLREHCEIVTDEPSGEWFVSGDELHFETGFWRARLVPERIGLFDGFRIYINSNIRTRSKWDELEWYRDIRLAKENAEGYLYGRS